MQEKTLPFATLCNVNEYSTQTQPPLNSTQVTDESDGVEDSTTFKMQQQRKKDETITPTKEKESSKSHPAEYVCVSAPILSLSGSQLKEGMPEDKESCQPHHADLQWSSQENAIFDADNRHDEPTNACVVNESSHTGVDFQELDIKMQDNTTINDITFKKCIKSPIEAGNPENAHKELSDLSNIVETVIDITANDERYAISTVQAVYMNSSQTSSSGMYIELAQRRLVWPSPFCLRIIYTFLEDDTVKPLLAATFLP